MALMFLICSPASQAALVMHLPLDGNLNDNTANGNNGNMPGGALNPVYTNAVYSQGLEFDGNNDFITIPHFNPGDTFSASLWVNHDSIGALNTFIEHAGNNNRNNFYIGYDNSLNSLTVELEDNNTTEGGACGDPKFCTGITLNDSRWYHIVVTVTPTTLNVYIDAELAYTTTHSTTVTFNNGIWLVGGDTDSNPTPSANNDYLDGRLDDIRIYNHELTQAEISALNGLQGHWTFDQCTLASPGDVLDSSGNNLHGTPFGGVTTTTGRICNALSLDGTDDYVEVADNSALDFDQTFTVMAWINPASFPPSDLMTIASKDTNYEFHITPTGYIHWWWEESGSNTRQIYSTVPVALNTWTHVAIVYAQGSQRILINGVERGTDNLNETLTLNTNPLQFGDDQGYADREFDGMIDEVKVYNRALNTEEILGYVINPDPTARACAVCGGGGGVSCATFRDEFTTQDYTRNDYGTAAWATNWVETRDDGSPAAGTIYINGGELQLDGDGSNPTIEREMDLSAYVGGTATFSFDYRTTGNLENNDRLRIQVSNGGAWTTLTDIRNDQPGATYSGDISTYISATTRIRFNERANSGNEHYHVDNVQIEACPVSTVDHFSIEYLNGATGTGINCQPQDIIIEAHDASHNVVNSFVGTVDLSSTLLPAATAGNGDWAKTAIVTDANGTLIPGAADSGSASYAFVAADAGSITLSYSNTNTQTVSLNVDASGTTETSGAAVAADDYEIAFAASGFRFLANGTTSLPLQIGAKPSDVAPGNQSWELQAIRTSDSSGACESAFTGTQTINIGFECLNPATCTGNNLEISTDGGTSYTAVTANAAGASPLTYQAVTGFDFGDNTDTTAPVVIRYNDAGRITLRAQHTLTPSNENMLSTDNNFVVRPFAYYIDVTGNPAATGPAGNAFTSAGTDFTVNLRAALWQAVDDDASGGVGIANDGIADGHEPTDTNPANNVNLADNPVALNYGQEVAPNNDPNPAVESVQLNAALNQPSPGANPGLDDSSANGSRITSFNLATGIGSTATVNYDEVGIIELYANVADNDYLDIGAVETANIVGRSGYVGRFYPHSFDTTLIQACNVFTYSGQPFSVTATARNNSSPATTTQNYTGVFALDTTLSDAGNTANFNGSNIIPAASFSNGTATKTDVAYTFPVKDTAPVTITLRANNVDNGLTAGTTEGNTEIRSGRMRLENAFGSELQPLSIPVRTEYFTDNGTLTPDDDGYIINTQDDPAPLTCSSYSDANVSFANYTGGLDLGEIAATGTGNITDGIEDAANPLLIHAPGNVNLGPGANNQGSVNILLNTPAWLEYNWGIDCDGDAVNDTDPCATASFGLFRGDDRIIYWREVFN